jgi:hypothetical protein
MSAIQPTNNTGLIIDEFIRYATNHLNTIVGQANMVSTFPPVGSPSPTGVLFWNGYFVDPSKPSVNKPIPPESKDVTEEDLKKIPNDNNTPEGVSSAVTQAGRNIITDDGDPEPQSRLANLTEYFPPDEPEFEILEEPISVQADGGVGAANKNNLQAEDIKCGEYTSEKGINYNAKVSPTFTLGDLSVKCNLKHKILAETTAEMGLTPNQVICNLQNLAINIIEPLIKQFPGYTITSVYRAAPAKGGALKSQHMKGEAIDIQWLKKKSSEIIPIANWCIENLPFDQLIFEHGNKIWLHISCVKGGPQRKELLTMWEGYLNYSDRNPPSKYRPGLHLHYKD